MAGGAKLSLSWLQGEVVGTDQRSDSYTSGGGRVVVFEGSGGGSSSTSTEVVVSRDIWLRDRDGQEHHVRISQDVPVRVGQEVALITCRGEVARGRRPPRTAGGLAAVYVLPTNRAYTVLPLQTVAETLGRMPTTLMGELGMLALWLVSLFLVIVYGIGIPLVALLTIRSLVRRRRRKARTAAILKEIGAEYQGLLDTLYSEHQIQLRAPGSSAAPSQIQSGASA